MRWTSVRKLVALAVAVGVVGWVATPDLGAQGILDRIKKATQDAQKAVDAKKAAEEAARKAREATEKKAPIPQAPPPGQAAAMPPGTGAPAAAAAAASSAKVEAEVLLTMDPGQQLSYVISPKGHHVAAVVLRGSREVLVYDGVDGPVFDEVLKRGAAPDVSFSPDGTRYGYIGRRGQEYVYMIDGKEFARFPAAALVDPGGNRLNVSTGFPSNQTTVPMFTSNGRHVYFLIVTKLPNGNAVSTFYFDGKPGPQSATDPPLSPAFSPDGEHHAYLVYDRQQSGRSALIVDGKQAAWQGGDPRFTGDSRHLVTTAAVNGGGTDVHLDGKPWIRAPGGVHLSFAPVTDLVVAAVSGRRFEDGWFLHVGNGTVPGSECATIGIVHFSADGKHWAAACKTPAGSTSMIVDGKKSLEYESVDGVAFLPDGRFVFKAVMPGLKHFIVVGNQESDAYQMIIPSGVGIGESHTVRSGEDPFAAVIAGNRVGFLASRTTNASGSVVVIDGKPTPAVNPTDLTLSADGARYAYASGGAGQPGQVIVDGVAHSGAVMAPGTNRLAKLTFSPDGKHIAYAAQTPDQRTRGVSVNGKFIPFTQPSAAPADNRTFTPDGRHLFWLTRLQRGRSAIYVDGVRAVELENDGTGLVPTGSTDQFATWWKGDDGTLTVIAQDGAALKRFRITPGADTSVDTLLRMTAIQ